MARVPSGIVLLWLVGACALDNHEYDEPDSASGSGSGSTTTASTGGSGSTSSTSMSTSGSGSSSSASTTTSTTSGMTTTSTTSTTSTTVGSTSESTGAGPEPMHLQHHDDGDCGAAIMCRVNGDPLGARIFSQECFTGLQPPFRVVKVGYVIAENRSIPASPAIAFRNFVGGAPEADPFIFFDLTAAEVTVGAHVHDVDVMIDAPGFCVGLAGGGDGTSLGVAVDGNGYPPPMQSWLKYQGYCLDIAPTFTDLSTVTSNAKGNWCIDADIVPL